MIFRCVAHPALHEFFCSGTIPRVLRDIQARVMSFPQCVVARVFSVLGFAQRAGTISRRDSIPTSGSIPEEGLRLP